MKNEKIGTIQTGDKAEETEGITEGLELKIKMNESGLVPVIVQDYATKEVLMLGYANTEALEKTMNEGYATFWSRSRKELWIKGALSGDYLEVKEILIDCDQDTLIYLVQKTNKGACHTVNEQGERRESCFYRRIKAGLKTLEFM